jgi:Reverse transcriptase (RNA-dependent DNA polymerase)
VDYYETFAPVAKLASIRTILAIAARNNWPIDMFDFHSAFLNGQLDEDEEVFMEQPPGYEESDPQKYCVKLYKSLYGLKQAGRKWYEIVCRTLAELGFKKCEADQAVFYIHAGKDILILAIHVDDCTMTGSSDDLIQNYKLKIKSKYDLTDLGPIHWLLGIKITRDRENRTISLSQSSYIDSLVRRFNFTDLKPYSTPMDPNIRYSKNQCPQTPEEAAEMRHIPYREAVGSLLYLAVATRPDIAFPIGILSQFVDNPGRAHWEGVKHVFRYLAGTRNWALVYGTKVKGLEGFTDADGATQEHRHAITGYAFLIDGGAVSWSSKKQEIVTLSTAESEYVAATHAAKEAIWLRRFIGEVFQPLTNPIPLYSDSQAAIALTRDGSYHARTKHIDIRYHFIRFVVNNGTINLIYCPTDDMVADTLTKALPNIKAKHFAFALGLQST